MRLLERKYQTQHPHSPNKSPTSCVAPGEAMLLVHVGATATNDYDAYSVIDNSNVWNRSHVANEYLNGDSVWGASSSQESSTEQRCVHVGGKCRHGPGIKSRQDGRACTQNTNAQAAMMNTNIGGANLWREDHAPTQCFITNGSTSTANKVRCCARPQTATSGTPSHVWQAHARAGVPSMRRESRSLHAHSQECR